MATSVAQNRTPQTNGLLPVAATQTYGNGASRQSSSRAPSQKLKVMIRRLAPGLTEAEFVAALGEEWRPAQGKVDWFQYKPGKVSKDPSKPSRPSRAYFHLTNETHVMNLSEKVRQSTFEDAQNTTASQCLVSPPIVEFALYGRTPGTRVRQDARAGTIDQDPEFMAFLEGLANPTNTKEPSSDLSSDGPLAKLDKVTTTPLVQFLKEKKANKSKEAAAKAAKKQEVAKTKSGKEASNGVEDTKKKGKDSKGDKVLEKASKEAVRILNREAATKVAAGAPRPSGSAATITPKPDTVKPPGRQRGAIAAAHIRMLQRDLGLTPAQAHRQVRRDAADAHKAERAAAAEKAATESKQSASTPTQQSQATPTAPKASQGNARKSRGRVVIPETEANKLPPGASSSTASAGPSTPIVLLRKPENVAPSPVTSSAPPTPSASRPPPNNSSRKPPPVAVLSTGATQAFVKHANPSQGVTEALLKEAMENFGAVSMVEIDKRKGFAYVDFVDTEGLKKAMAANPVSVAQGTVQVMQRKGTALPPEKKPTHPAIMSRGGGRGGRGVSIGRRGGRGAGRGGNNAAASSSEPAKAPASAPAGPAAK